MFGDVGDGAALTTHREGQSWRGRSQRNENGRLAIIASNDD
jgi:hypothetical protein